MTGKNYNAKVKKIVLNEAGKKSIAEKQRIKGITKIDSYTVQIQVYEKTSQKDLFDFYIVPLAKWGDVQYFDSNYKWGIKKTKADEIIKKKGVTGGRGGLGNWHFKSATNQTPRYAQPGEPAVERTVILELKLLADIGLVGFPNAGKSTLLSTISAARPKIADYPFTTLEPNLGIVSYRDNRSFVMADIPGIIEGASEGKGLGLRFLRHVERNAVLLFMVPADTDSIRKEYDILLRELTAFNPDLQDKQRVLAVTKCDMLDDELIEAMKNDLPDVPVVFISSVTGQGITELKDVLWRELNDEENRVMTLTHRNLDERHRVEEEDNFDTDLERDESGDESGDDNFEEEDW